MRENRKKFIALFLCIAIAFGLFTNVSAASDVLKITSIENTGKSETATVETPSIDENGQIRGGVVFDAQGDYADYLLTIQNTDDYAYRIDSVEDNNSTDALNITYTHDDTIGAKASIDLLLHLEYADQLINQESLDINDLHIEIRFTRIEQKDNDQPVTPNTSDGVIGSIFGLSGALLVAMFALHNVIPRKIRIAGSGFAILLAGSAAGMYVARAANVEKIDIAFSTIDLESVYEEYSVSIDTGDGPVTQTVTYGTPLSEILVRPTKTGYHFDKWTDGNGNTVDENGIVEGPMTITANMEPNQYNIVFKKNDGTDATASQTMTYDTEANLLDLQFTRPGYNFDGWATSTDGAAVYANKALVVNLTTTTDDVELFAKWSKRTDIEYTVRHSYENLMDDDYTNDDIPMTGSVDTDITPERKPKTGYITPEAKTERIEADGSSVITYIYDLERVELSLNDTDDIETTTAAGEYKYGYPISLTAKDKTGYDFEGWSDGTTIVSTDKAYNFNISSTITLTPSYQIQKYTVTIDPNNGTAPTEHANVEYNTAYSTLLPEQPSKTGHAFVNWTDSDSNVITGESKVTGATTVTANYEANIYHVVFNSNGGEGEMASQEFTYGEVQNLSSNAFARAGYSFAGWATASDGPVVYADGVEVSNLTDTTDDVVLYAKWTLRTDISYIVRHSYENLLDDNYTNEDIPMTGSVDTDITPERRPRTGYVTPESKTERINADGSSIITYQYDLERKELTLGNTEHIVDGSSAAGQYKYGTHITLTAENLESHNFLGWSNGSSIVSEELTYEFDITETVALEPSYEIKKFTVTVNRGGSTPEVHNNVEYGTELSTILGEAPTKTGYHFVSWTAGGEEVTGSDTVTSSMEITANLDPNNYTVIFHKNDGNEADDTVEQQMTYDQSATLTKNSFEYPGYNFGGWATSREGEVAYEDEEQVSNLTTTTDDVNLYAKWELRTDIDYTIIHSYEHLEDDDFADEPEYKHDGSIGQDIELGIKSRTGYENPEIQTVQIEADGSSTFTYLYYLKRLDLTLNDADDVSTSTPAGSYKYGTAIYLEASPREGYDFAGWYDNSSQEIIQDEMTLGFNIEANTNLTPTYNIKKFTITVDPGNGEASTTFNNVNYGTSLSTILTTEPTKTGYYFSEWTDQNGHTVYEDDDVVTGPMTITGNFNPNGYKVAFNANTGSGAMEDQDFTYDDEAVALRKNAFERPGYEFAGWSTTAGGNVVYVDEAPVRNLTSERDGTVNLYAKWTLLTNISYTVYHRYENVGTGFSEVTTNELGSVDTPITPETIPETGFQDPVADNSTPIPGQIDASGESFFIYYYYRIRKQLTINSSEYVATDTPTGSYKYGTTITVTAVDRIGYEFSGWSLDDGETITETDATYSFVITEDTILTPVYEEKPFYYAFNHPGACEFSATDPISGETCSFVGDDYIETNVKLYDEEHYNMDYEIGFTIDRYDDEQVQQATLMNAKYEMSGTTSPGIAVRRSGNTANAEITQAINGSKTTATISSPTSKTVKIIRVDGIVYYSINGGNLQRLQVNKGTSDYHDITTWFGASFNPNDSENPIWRRFSGKLSNMYIKMGTYDGPTVTVTFDAGEGSTDPEPIRLPTGQTIKDLPVPVNESGLFFTSWYKDKDIWQQNVTENVTTFNEDTTLYARWSSSNNACLVNGVEKATLSECVTIAKQTGTSSVPAKIILMKDVNNAQIDIATGEYVDIDGRGYFLNSKNDKYIIESYGTVNVEDVRFSSTANQGAINVKGGNLNIYGGIIDVKRTDSSCRQGIFVDGDSTRVGVYDGTVITTSCGVRAAVQIDRGTINIVDAKIVSKNYSALDGSRATAGGTFILGTEDGTINNATPDIRSEGSSSNAIKLGNKTLEFYDGRAYSVSAVVSGTAPTTEQNAIQQTTPLDSEFATYNWLYYAMP